MSVDPRLVDRLIARALERSFDTIDGAVTPADKDGKVTRQELQAAAQNSTPGSEAREASEALLANDQLFDRMDGSSNQDGAISRRDVAAFLDLTREPVQPPAAAWKKLDTVRYPGKQDDIFFANPKTGWYVNGTQSADKAGRIYKTEDGGVSWKELHVAPGTFFRCIGFVDELHGFAGNIGTDYFPNVSDKHPLYETRDGGKAWEKVTTIDGPLPIGMCAIDVAKVPYIHSGRTEYRTVLHAAGRVGGPAHLLRSTDEGKSWRSHDLSEHLDMITDVKFMTEKRGFVVGGKSHGSELRARIIVTEDGGKTWTPSYQDSQTGNTVWKLSFPTPDVGYATLLNAAPSTSSLQRIAKTTDGGKTWVELPLVDDANAKVLGIGFVDANRGWVGTTTGGFATTDGGKTFTKADGMGPAVNKLRFLPRPDGFIEAFAIGLNVDKLTIAPPPRSLTDAMAAATAECSSPAPDRRRIVSARGATGS